MKFRVVLSLVLLVGCGGLQKAATLTWQTTNANCVAVDGNAPTPPAHVILIIEENHSFSAVYPTGMPWMSALGDVYGIAINYFSDEPGSMLDYLWLSSGSGEHAFGCEGSGCSHVITSDNIFRELNKAGLSWKVYAESLPYAGYMGVKSGEYVKRHNPAPWYSDIANHPAQQQKMVPFTQSAKDLAARNLPNYSLIIPDLLHDAHNGTMAKADQWLKQYIRPALSSPYFKLEGNGIMFITFDNGNGDKQSQVFTGVIGPGVITGAKVNTEFRHENTLRTMMELLSLKHFPGASAQAAPMLGFFSSSCVDISSDLLRVQSGVTSTNQEIGSLSACSVESSGVRSLCWTRTHPAQSASRQWCQRTS